MRYLVASVSLGGGNEGYVMSSLGVRLSDWTALHDRIMYLVVFNYTYIGG